MKKHSKKNIRKLFRDIITNIHNLDDCRSVSLVGSFSNHFDFSRAADVDVVIVCNKLNKDFLANVNNTILYYNKILLSLSNKKKILINNNFGPLKYDNIKTLVLHVMIYDIKSHKDHVLKSPFTCLDWERSNFYIGQRLKDIYPVGILQLKDFHNTRRGIESYVNDILNNRISYSKYIVGIKKINLKKTYAKINAEEKKIFLYHIFSNLTKNLLKFESGLNISFNSIIVQKKYKLIVSDNENLKKISLSSKYAFINSISKFSNLDDLALNFLNYFNVHISKYKNFTKITFKRHLKTNVSKNTFLGSGSNPGIVSNTLKKYKQKNYSYIFSSPLKRAIQTSRLFTDKKRIIVSDFLKEINYGKFEMCNFNYVKKINPFFAHKLNSGKDPKFPNGENTRDVLKRVNQFLKYLNEYQKPNSKIMIVTHNVFLRCLFGQIFNIPIDKWYLIKVDYNKNYDFILKDKKLIPNFSRSKINSLLMKINV